jgi:hypothetical protein
MRTTILTLAVLSLLACNQHSEAAREQPARTSTPSQAAAVTPAPAGAVAGVVTVRKGDGSELLTIRNVGGGRVDIEFVADGARRVLRGEEKESGKRKYRIGDGPVLLEAKPGDGGGFKVRMPDGTLRWKVKIGSDKIKVSDNEENRNPFELEPKGNERTKVKAADGHELGAVRFDSRVSRSTVEDASGKALYTVDGAHPSPAYGVLLLDGIPETQRYVILAEILARGR